MHEACLTLTPLFFAIKKEWTKSHIETKAELLVQCVQ